MAVRIGRGDVEQLAALHHALGVTSAGDLGGRGCRSRRPRRRGARANRSKTRLPPRCPISGGRFRGFRWAGRSRWSGRSSSGCARRPAWSGPAPAVRCAADRIRSATSRSWPRPPTRPSAIAELLQLPDIVRCSSSKRSPAVPAVRARPGRRPPAGPGQCGRDAVAGHRIGRAISPRCARTPAPPTGA